MKKKINWSYPILLLILMILIYYLSSQIGDDSDVTSGRICQFLAQHFFTGYWDLSKDAQTRAAEGLTLLVRKGAHFSEYALMGCLWYLWLHRIRFGMLIAFAATVLYSLTDEIHQLFVPGRTGQFKDVLIDSSGGLCGILAGFVLLCVIYCIRRREIVHGGTWES